jgi:YesN/AraC family two-component response regulator
MKKLSILMADDEVYVRRFLESVIKNENLPVAALYQADNGMDAIALTREHRPDLLFLDIRMPGLDGLKAAKQIVKDGYSGKIVIVSAHSEFEYAREAFRIGVSDYLLKPVKPAEFSAFILEAAQSEQEKPPLSQPREKPLPALVRAVLAHISENLNTQTKVGDIARVVHLSPWHLSRTFKKLDGRSIMGCLREMRIDRAKELLADGDLSVTEISLAVGFENAGYFATCFKQATGMSPSEYRQKKCSPKFGQA